MIPVRGLILVKRFVFGIALACATAGIFAGSACGGGGATVTSPERSVQINSIDPSSGTIGTELVIEGSGFDGSANDVGFISPGSGSRTFNIGYVNRIPSPDGKTLRFTVPELLGACVFTQIGADVSCPAIGLLVPIGDVSVAIYNRSGTSNSVVFHREASAIETAQSAVDQSDAYHQMTAFLDGKVGATCHPSCGPNSASVGIGFHQSNNGDVYIEVSVHGMDMNEVKDAIPSEIAGYEVRLS